VYVEIHAELSAATYNLTWQVTDPSNIRLSGANRYETSYEISKANFSNSDVAVLASGSSFADALCASGLAGMRHAPLLLLPPALFDEDGILTEEGKAFRAECKRLGVNDFEVVGGTAVISDELLQDAKELAGTIDSARLAGYDRYSTSAVVMDYMVHELGHAPSVVIAARGDQFADALSAAPYAYANGYPILLVDRNWIGYPVTYSLQGGTPDVVYVLGGTSAVTEFSVAEIDRLVPTVKRIAGANRYETALSFASFVVDDLGAASWANVGLATGANFPDALSGGAACGSRGGVLLLTEPTTLNKGVAAKLGAEAPGVDRVMIFGGTSAVSSTVEMSVSGILNR